MNFDEKSLDIVPQAVAARAVGISSQAVANRIQSGSISSFKAFGRTWVSIADLRAARQARAWWGCHQNRGKV